MIRFYVSGDIEQVDYIPYVPSTSVITIIMVLIPTLFYQNHYFQQCLSICKINCMYTLTRVNWLKSHISMSMLTEIIIGLKLCNFVITNTTEVVCLCIYKVAANSMYAYYG